MLRKLNPEICLGFLTASLFWIGVVIWQSSYTPTEKQKDECYETAKKIGLKVDECKTFLEKTTSDPVALFTLALAVSTLGLWFATITLYRAGDEQLVLARAEFTATLRPRIIVRLIQGPSVEGEHEFAFVTFANVGETPAKIRAIGIDLARRRTGDGMWLPPGYDFTTEDIDAIVLVSGQRYTRKVYAKTPVSGYQKFLTASGDAEICVIGAIKYCDDNGTRMETAFLRVYDGKAKRFVPSNNPEEEYQD